jgi:hypothetical protein
MKVFVLFFHEKRENILEKEKKTKKSIQTERYDKEEKEIFVLCL